jgi:cell division protein FtsN
LQKLDSKNINGFISEHKVRDQIWYRVRFGEFNSKDEARAAAMKHGFAQSWIDRIK